MVLSFVLALALLAPLSTWGFSLERKQSYLQSATEQRLWEDPQWLRLGHYRKSLIGNYESVLRGPIFLAKDGMTNSQAELLATVDALFDKSTSLSTQCLYLSRMSWLKKKLSINTSDIHSCPERDQWKQQLGAEEIYIVFASSDLNSAGSSFGHTFLRLHNPKNTKERELLDYGVNYAAVTGEEQGALYALKGLFGFYPGSYSMLPYHQKLREYTNLEGRNIWEYRLKLTPEEVSLVVDHLLEIEQTYSYYYFLSDNCARQILELLEVARPTVDLSSSHQYVSIPLDAVKTLADNNLLEGEKLRLSLQSDWQARYAKLSGSQKSSLREFLKTEKKQSLDHLFPKEKAEVLESALSVLAIKEYRENKNFKELKYDLAVTRAQLGNLTEPVQIETPRSPLLSPKSRAFYLGGGEELGQSFISAKYRRAFNDLLSDDSGLNPFSELQAVGIELRQYQETKNIELYQFTALKIFNSLPVNDLDSPMTWSFDLGTRPKFIPYLNFGVGYSYDYNVGERTRLSGLLVSENSQLSETARFRLGPEFLLITKWTPEFRSLFGAKYLHDFKKHGSYSEVFAGVSKNLFGIEVRGEVSVYEQDSSFQLSVIF